MKITKTRLKQIITEEITSVLTELNSLDDAAATAAYLLRTITRQRDKRGKTADMVRHIFKILGGPEAVQALDDVLANVDMTPRSSDIWEEKDDDWIQDAEKDIEKRGTEGVCTGDKFGSEECPPGSKRYNLAKTFRKMAKDKKK